MTMSKEELKAEIAGLLKDEGGGAGSRSQEVRAKLRDFAEALQESLGDKVQVRLEAGQRLSRRGQQWNFVVRVPAVEFRDELFEAWVAPGGSPVILDLSDDDQPRCDTLDALERKVLEFLRNEDVKARLYYARALAA